MKKIYLCLLAAAIVTSAFSQNNSSGATAHETKKHTEKGTQIDGKLAEVLKSIDSKMVQVNGGNFTMGCINQQDTECLAWEKPRHTVTISSFYMSKTDVTQAEWKAVMGNTPSGKYCAECPVVNVTWNDVGEFINKLNQLTGKVYRLPTEAEWEYAAKGGDKGHGYKYAGDNNPDAVAWYDSTKAKEVHPVMQKKANELGLFDMSGDVWQWCSDWFEDKYYSNSPSNNPTGPANGKNDKVVRGGSWWGPLKDCRVANRDKFPPTSKDDDVGFRLVRTK